MDRCPQPSLDRDDDLKRDKAERDIWLVDTQKLFTRDAGAHLRITLEPIQRSVLPGLSLPRQDIDGGIIIDRILCHRR